MRPDRRELAAIFAGGCAGAIARAELAAGLRVAPGSWPWATLLVNLAGAALLGWVLARPARPGARRDYRRPLLGTGFCGALTTFSTLQLELLEMVDRQRWGLALGYAPISVAGGLALVALGARAARPVPVP